MMGSRSTLPDHRLGWCDGRWGSNVVSRGRWDVNGFEAQTATFVTRVRDGYVCFACQGQRTTEVATGITLEDAAWFYDFARRLSERRFATDCWRAGPTVMRSPALRALRDRIRQIGDACGRHKCHSSIRDS
jgi:hypothetical protein